MFLPQESLISSISYFCQLQDHLQAILLIEPFKITFNDQL